VFFEVVLLVLCFTVGHWVWKEHIAFRITTWYDVSSAGEKHLTAAGYWRPQRRGSKRGYQHRLELSRAASSW
jgi:hypothetical protein